MSLINISNLTFSYDGSYDNIFENVSFQIDTDWKLGFIGRNGRGKTTFLNLLMGKYEYGGEISASVDFDYFPFEVADKTQNTIDVVYNLNESLELWELKRELSLLEMSEETMYRPFYTLSSGEQTKLLLASLFLRENHFLLIDEPTNHLDYIARNILGGYLKSKSGYILVSHDRALLDICIDHVLSINKADIEIQKGNFSSWWNNKQLRDSFEIAENEKLRKDIKKLTASARRTADWSDKVEKTKFGTLNSGIKPDKGRIGHKAAKMMKRSTSIEKRKQDAITEKSELLKNIEAADKLAVKPLYYHKDRLLELNNVSIQYGTNTVLSKLSFTVNTGDRVSLKGKNGSGKSSVLKLLAGESISFMGNLNKGSNLVISYVSQDTSYLSGCLRDFAENNGIDESLFKSILRKFDFSRVQFDKDMSEFSCGQKKKVLIAKSLCEKAHLYIWDEPLNFIDVISRMQIEDLILASRPTIIFVEHDSAFSDRLSTKTVTL